MRKLPPSDLIEIASGVRYRRALDYDLAAFFLTTLINTGAGVFRTKKSKRLKIKDLLGREPMGTEVATAEDQKARKESLLALHRKVSKGEQRG